MSAFDRVRVALETIRTCDDSEGLRDAALAALAEIERELERERMRLAACGVVATCDTPESAVQARDMPHDFLSASCEDVIRRAERALKERSNV